MPLKILQEKEVKDAQEIEAEKKADRAQKDFDKTVLATVQRKAVKDLFEFMSRIDWNDKALNRNGHAYYELVIRVGQFATNIDPDPRRSAAFARVVTDYQRCVEEKEEYRAHFRERQIYNYYGTILQFAATQLTVPEVLYNLPPEMWGKKTPQTADLQDR